MEQIGGEEMLTQSDVNPSCGIERGSQVEDISCKSFSVMLLVFSWEGQAYSWWVSKQRRVPGEGSRVVWVVRLLKFSFGQKPGPN